MAIYSISAQTLDDLLHDTYTALRTQGTTIQTSRGTTTEITAAVLELTNPLARLSRSESRGVVISCLGELCWYLAGEDSVEMIRYYVSAYDEEAVDGKVLGAYGPRLFGAGAGNQFSTIFRRLVAKPTTRRAVLQLYDATDLLRESGDVPCTCTIQFLTRAEGLDTIVYMRSNDAVKGLPHDIFCFTMLQELLAKALGLAVGRYFHIVGSLHTYANDEGKLSRFLDEGFQSTTSPMPAMPDGDPWPAVKQFLLVETALREGRDVSAETWATLPTYWQSLGQLLQAFRFYRTSRRDRLMQIRDELGKSIYAPFLNALLSKDPSSEASSDSQDIRE